MKRIILFLFVLFFSLFSNTKQLLANDIGKDLENNSSSQIEVENPNVNKKTENSDSSLKDLFGDEQTFPFVAGLGKNAAH